MLPAVMLRRNPAMVAHPFDSDAREPMVVCEVPDTQGELARFAIPSALFDLVSGFDGETKTAEVVRRFAREGRTQRHGEEDLARLVERFLLPRRLLIAADEETIAATAASPRSKSSPLYLRFPLLPMRAVNLLERPLGWLYEPGIAWPALLLILAAHVAFYGWVIPEHPLKFGELTGGQLAAVFVIAGLGMIAHELGHTTAAIRYGCRRVAIGWGLYLFLIVGFANLSEVWRLHRRQRAVVDAGGVYFQGLFALVLLLVHLASGAALPLYAFVLANLTMAASLNPFLKLDGYWVVSDLTGIANLHAQSARMIMAYWRRLWNRNATLQPIAWPLSGSATTVLAVYSLLSMVFFAYLFARISQWLVWNALHTYPQQVASLPTALSSGPTQAVSNLLGFAMRTLVLYGMLRFTYGIGQGIVRYARAAMSARREPIATLEPERAPMASKTI